MNFYTITIKPLEKFWKKRVQDIKKIYTQNFTMSMFQMVERI